MAGPFPGMDPYLEDPHEWPDLHGALIAAIRDTLAAQVAPHYTVRIEQRVYIASAEELSRQTIAPDVYIVQNPQSNSATAQATLVSPATLIEPLYDEEVRDRFLEIRDVRNREVVTTLELLSPANKTPGSQGRRQFARKRRAVLGSRTHWIEVDLLREGQRPREVAGKSDYYALLRRVTSYHYTVWYANLRDSLPTIAVPLSEPHPDVTLDLQAVLDGVYERAFYALNADYSRLVPDPPLSLPDAAWVAARIREWQLARAAAPE